MSKSKKKITEYSLLLPIFNQKIKILIGCKTALETKLDKEDLVLENLDTADACCFSLDEIMYIWFETNPKISIVAHEAAHATFAIMSSYGLDIKDQEVFCYILEFLVDNILKCVTTTLPIVTDHINQK